MAGPTYEPITTNTLGSSATTITLSSIPATYTDLRLVLTGKAVTGDDVYIRFNGDSATNYSVTGMKTFGSNNSSASVQNQQQIDIDAVGYNLDSSWPQIYAYDIFAYTSSKYKTVLCKESGMRDTTGANVRAAALWRSTSAITSISITCNGSFQASTIVTLWGIKAA